MFKLLRPVSGKLIRSNYAGVRFRGGRIHDQQSEDSVIREAKAFGLLAQHPRVRLQLDAHQAKLYRLSSQLEADGVVELGSDELKKLIRESNSSLSVVESATGLPLFRLNSQSDKSSKVGARTGIKLAKGERGKMLRMGVNIDDHMLSVRVKQAEEFLDSNYVVTVVVKLPRSFCKPAPDKPDAKTTGVAIDGPNPAKIMYDVETKRFVSAFSTIPSAAVRLIDRQQPSEIVLVLRRSSSPHPDVVAD